MKELKISRGNTSMNLRQLMDWGIVTDGTAKTKELIKQTKALKDLTNDLDTLMNKLVNQKQNWLTKSVFKLIK